MNDAFNLDFPRAYGPPPITAQLKIEPEDFYVEEQLGFEPAGTGEHLYLFIEKRNHNTQFVAEHIATVAKIKLSDVSYSGMKDRRALTQQWYSLYLPKSNWPPTGDLNWLPAMDEQNPEKSVRLLRSVRHTKKLRRGDHASNLFRLRLRNVLGDHSAIEARLKIISEQGVPHYYGEQRFGHQGANLREVAGFLERAKGKQRGFQDRLKVSVMRSWLFNRILSERVRDLTWNHCVEGDPQVEPSGSLWGRGRLASADQLKALEERVINEYPEWCHFLEHCGLQQERRSLILKPQALSHQLHEDTLELEFLLPAGGYATTLLREVAGNEPPINGIVAEA